MRLFSPILSIASYQSATYMDGSEAAICLTEVDTFWPAFYFVSSITIFFLLPLVILLILYSIIAIHLMNNPGLISHGHRNNVLKYRKQVIFMLGAVVLSFFVCLMPFRAFTLWIIVVPSETIMSLGIDGYYMLLYFCRIMLYLNSAMNPILYNLMSSKFRNGFLKLLGCGAMVKSKDKICDRKGTFHTTSTNLSNSSQSVRRDLRNSLKQRDESGQDPSAENFNNIAAAAISGDNGHQEVWCNTGSTCLSTNLTSIRKLPKSFDDIEETEEYDDYTDCPKATNQLLTPNSMSKLQSCSMHDELSNMSTEIQTNQLARSKTEPK